MRPKKPHITRLEQVRISRNGAIIEFLDPAVATTSLRSSPQVQAMTDGEIPLVFNRTVSAGIRNRDEPGEYVAVEVPPGSPQVEESLGSTRQWVPRGGVLRCVIHNGGGEDGSLPVINVDDQEVTWDQFGKMLCTFAGWGMRVVFVPSDELERTPKIVVREPEG
jgi:hypothetical protein